MPNRSKSQGLRFDYGLCASACLAILIGLELAQGPGRPALMLAPRSVTLLALLGGALALGVGARRARSRRAQLLTAAAGLAPLLLLPIDPPGLALSVLLAYGGLCAAGIGSAANSPKLLRGLLGACLLSSLFAPAAAPHLLWFVVTPAVLAIAVVVASHAQAATARQGAMQGIPLGLRQRVGRAAQGRSARSRGLGLSHVGRDVLPLLIVFAILVPSLAVLLERLPDPSLGSDKANKIPRPGDGIDSESAQAGGSDRSAFDAIFPEDAPIGGRVMTLQHEEIMWVRSSVAGAQAIPIGPVYLRGFALDRFGRDGLTAARRPAPRRFLDGNDGELDGWTSLRSGWKEQDIVLEIEQAAIYLEGSRWSLLFAPAGLRAIDVSPVEWQADQILAAVNLPEFDLGQGHVHRLRCVERRGNRLDLSVARIAKGPRNMTDLPGGAPGRALSLRAQAIAEEAETPEARLAAVLDHFATGFVYDIGAQHPPGLEGVLAFLDRRRGFCTTYASAATALLRALDIPARVATGFCASTWDEEQEAYRVTTAQGHAWIEVLFDDLGWVVFDPTPRQERLREIASATRAPGEGLGDWGAEVLHDMRRWQSLGDAESWDELIATLALFPGAIATSASTRPLLFAAPLLAFAIWLILRPRRRPGDPRPKPGGAASGSAAGPQSEPLEKRLVAELDRRGHRRLPSDPLLGLARRAARQSPALGQAPGLAVNLQRARFGAGPLSRAEQLAANSVLKDWEAQESRP